MKPNPEARPRRLIPRFPVSLSVEVRLPGGAARAYPARDVSQGGFFLATEDAFELFSDVQLNVQLPTGKLSTLKARVVHILSPDKAQGVGVPAGVGVQFEGLNELQQGEVAQLVAWARANDTRPRIGRVRPGANLAALQGEPLLTYVLEHVDGKRDPEALADELGIEVASVERMLRELVRLEVIDLLAATGEVAVAQPPRVHAQTAAAPQPTAAATGASARPDKLSAEHAAHLEMLEQRLLVGNFYHLLNVAEDASIEHIRTGFQTQQAGLRPSRAPATEMPRIERLQNHLREAYGVLSSAQKRSEYDQYLERDRQLHEARRSPRPQAMQRVGVAADAPPARKPATPGVEPRKPAGAERPRAGAPQAAPTAPLGAAAQILVEAEQALSAGKLAEAGRHLQLLTAMTFEDAKIRARVAHLKTVVFRAQAVDFEKQAAYEEKQQRWALAARSWLRVAEGRPKDSMPLQRAALAQLQAGVDLRQVMEIAKRAVELAEQDPQAHRILARVYVAAGMQANARRELEAAERCSPAPTAAAAPAKQAGIFQRLLGRDPN